jgi:serine phosphatase RsbU (regulator of sigma subunit)
VILSPGAEPCFAWDGRSTPLAIRRASDGPRCDAALTLAPGSTVLLYTDGLVERRSESLTDGLDRLLRTVAQHREETAAALVAAVVRALHDPAHIDDVCVLAVSLS